jgi:hypothetical protein
MIVSLLLRKMKKSNILILEKVSQKRAKTRKIKMKIPKLHLKRIVSQVMEMISHLKAQTKSVNQAKIRKLGKALRKTLMKA